MFQTANGPPKDPNRRLGVHLFFPRDSSQDKICKKSPPKGGAFAKKTMPIVLGTMNNLKTNKIQKPNKILAFFCHFYFGALPFGRKAPKGRLEGFLSALLGDLGSSRPIKQNPPGK